MGSFVFKRRLTLVVFAISSVSLSSFLGFSSSLAAPPNSPYLPGETLNPTCAPGDANCTVSISESGFRGDGTFVSLATSTVQAGIGATSSLAKFYIQSTSVGTSTLYLQGTAGQTANIFSIASSSALRFFEVFPGGVASSTEFRSPSSTITTLTVTTCVGCGLSGQADGAMIIGSAAGNGTSTFLLTVVTSTGAMTLSTSSFIGNVSTTLNVTIGGTLQSNAGQATFASVSSTNAEASGYGKFPTLNFTNASGTNLTLSGFLQTLGQFIFGNASGTRLTASTGIDAGRGDFTNVSSTNLTLPIGGFFQSLGTSSVITNVSSSRLDISGFTSLASASSSGNVTFGGTFQSNAGQSTFAAVSSTNWFASGYATILNLLTFGSASSTGNVTVGGTLQSNAGQNTFGNVSSTNLDVATRFNFAAASSTGNVTFGGTLQNNAGQSTFASVSSTNLFASGYGFLTKILGNIIGIGANSTNSAIAYLQTQTLASTTLLIQATTSQTGNLLTVASGSGQRFFEIFPSGVVSSTEFRSPSSTIDNFAFTNASGTRIDLTGMLTFSSASSTGNVTFGGSLQANAGQSTFSNVSSTNLDVATRFNFAAASSTGNVTFGGTLQANAGQATFGTVSSTALFSSGYLQVLATSTLGTTTITGLTFGSASGTSISVTGYGIFPTLLFTNSSGTSLSASSYLNTPTLVATTASSSNVSSTNLTATGYGLLTSLYFTNASGTNVSSSFISASASGTTALKLTGYPARTASGTLVLLGPFDIQAGNTSGTLLGANPDSGFQGNFIDLQINSSTKFRVDNGGNVSSTNITLTGTLASLNASSTNVSSTRLDVTGFTSLASASSSGNVTIGGTFQSNAGQSTFAAVSSTNWFASGYATILNLLTFGSASSTGNVTVGGSLQSNAGQNTLGNVSSTNLDVATRFNFAAASSTGNVTLGGSNTQILNQLTFANASSTNIDVATRLNFAAASSTGNVTIGGTLQANAGQSTFGTVSSTALFSSGYLQILATSTLGTTTITGLTFTSASGTSLSVTSYGVFPTLVFTNASGTSVSSTNITASGYGSFTTTSSFAGNLSIGTTTAPITQLHIPVKVPGGLLSNVVTGASAVALAVQGRYAYVGESQVGAGGNGIEIYDISNPTSAPVLLTGIATGTHRFYGLTVQGKYLYGVSDATKVMVIYDISNPKSPALVSSSTTTGTSPFRIIVSGKYAYVGNNSGSTALEIYDVSNPFSPALVGTYSTNLADGLAVQGRYAYMAAYTANLVRILDVSNPAKPTSVGSLSLAANSNPGQIQVQGRYAYITNQVSKTLQAIDIKDPTTPVSVSTTTTGTAVPYDFRVSGRYAYVAYSSGARVEVFDISDPTAMVSVGSVSVASNVAVVQGRYLYLVRGDSNFTVFDMGGSYIQHLETGLIEAGNLSVRNNISALDADLRGGLVVGQSLNVMGDFSAAGSLSLASSTSQLLFTGSNFSVAYAGTSTALAYFQSQALASTTLFIQATTSQTANLLTVASSTGQRFFEILAPSGIVSSSQMIFVNASGTRLDLTNASSNNVSSTNITIASRLDFAAASSTGNVTIGGTFQSNAGQSTFATVSSTNMFTSGYLTVTGSSTFIGNVGIGTTTVPSSLLYVTGSLNPNTNASAVKIAPTFLSSGTNSLTYTPVEINPLINVSGVLMNIRMLSVTGTVSNVGVGGGTLSNLYGLYVDIPTNGGGNNYAAIFKGGNVGIGNTSPQTTLDITGSVSSTNAYHNGYLTVTGVTTLASASTTSNVTIGGTLQSNAGQNTFGNVSSTNLDVATRFNFAAASSTGNVTFGGTLQSNAGQATLASVSSTNIGASGTGYFLSNLGIGTTTAQAQIHSVATTEQLRLGYNSRNYVSFTVGSGGDLTVAGNNSASAGSAITITPGTATSTGTGGLLTLNGGAAAATAGSNGGAISILGAAGSSTGTGGAGGALTLTAGNGAGDGTVSRAGGAVTITAGTSVGSTVGGAVTITAGTGSTFAGGFAGGPLSLNAGAAGAGAGNPGGPVSISSGAGTSTGNGGVGGAITITAGNAGGDGSAGRYGGAITITAGKTVGAGNQGGALTLSAGAGSDTGGSGWNGGVLTLNGGTAGAVAGSAGGPISILGADGSSTGTGGNGGAVTITGGNGSGTGNKSGGAITLTAGNATGTTAGAIVELLAGSGIGGNANGGNIYITGGALSGTGSSGNVILANTSGGTARGLVGIGNTSPQATLDITGSVSSTNAYHNGYLTVTGNSLFTGSNFSVASAGTSTALGFFRGTQVGSTTLALQGFTNQTADIFDISSSTGLSLFGINSIGQVFIGTSTAYGATSTLTVCARTNCTAPTTASSTNTVAFFASTGGLTTNTSIVARGVITSGLTDIGEYAPVVGDESQYHAGDLLSISLNEPGKFEKSSPVYDTKLAGVVTETAGLVAGGGEDNHSHIVIALAGRVPVKVTEENGAIKLGDRLTVSRTKTGYAMKMTESGQSIGIALQDFSADKDKILVFLNLGYQRISVAEKANGTITTTETGKDLNMNGFAITNAKAIAGLSGKWSIDEGGNLIAKTVKTEKLCIGSTCVDEATLKTLLEKSGLLGSPLPASSNGAASLLNLVTGSSVVATNSTTTATSTNTTVATSTSTGTAGASTSTSVSSAASSTTQSSATSSEPTSHISSSTSTPASSATTTSSSSSSSNSAPSASSSTSSSATQPSTPSSTPTTSSASSSPPSSATTTSSSSVPSQPSAQPSSSVSSAFTPGSAATSSTASTSTKSQP